MTYLLEHNVINPHQIDSSMTDYVRQVRTQEAKEWFIKKLRLYIINDETLLRQISASEVEITDPQYVRDAIDRGDKVYRFEPSKMILIKDRIDNVLHFFQSLEEFSVLEPTNELMKQQVVIARRWLSKIPKMTLPQVEDAALEWGKLAAAGLSVANKEGVVIIHRWDDGMYAVRYTDKAVMQKDGADLQNCLRTGTYWSDVERQSQWVVSIRKANDEAVVGMRWVLKAGQPYRIDECKGKNNKPVGEQYIPYVLDLLHKFKLDDNTYDLKNAGIFYNKDTGNYGNFDDIATTYESGGIKFMYSTSMIKIKIGNKSRILNIHDGGVQENELVGGDFTTDESIKILNNFPKNIYLRTRSDQYGPVHDALAPWGVFKNNGVYGSAKDVGKYMGPILNFEGYQTQNSVVLIKDGKSHVFRVENNKVVSFPYELSEDINTLSFIEIVNFMPAIGKNLHDQCLAKGYVNHNGKYKKIVDVGEKLEDDVEGIDVWKYKKEFIAFSRGMQAVMTTVFFEKGGKLNCLLEDIKSGLVQNIILRQFPKLSGDQQTNGYFTFNGETISNEDQFVETIEKLVAKDGDLKSGQNPRYQISGIHDGTSIGYMLNMNNISEAMLAGSLRKLTRAHAVKLFNALNPLKAPAPFFAILKNKEKIYGKEISYYKILLPQSLHLLKKIWLQYPDLKERVKKIYDSIAEKTTKFIKEMTEKNARIEIETGFNDEIISEAISKIWAAQRENHTHIERYVRDMQPSGSESASERLASLNAINRIRRNT